MPVTKWLVSSFSIPILFPLLLFLSVTHSIEGHDTTTASMAKVFDYAEGEQAILKPAVPKCDKNLIDGSRKAQYTRELLGDIIWCCI